MKWLAVAVIMLKGNGVMEGFCSPFDSVKRATQIWTGRRSLTPNEICCSYGWVMPIVVRDLVGEWATIFALDPAPFPLCIHRQHPVDHWCDPPGSAVTFTIQIVPQSRTAFNDSGICRPMNDSGVCRPMIYSQPQPHPPQHRILLHMLRMGVPVVLVTVC